MIDKSKAINEIVDQFNWERVHKAMTALDWKWSEERYHSVPTIGALFRCAVDLLHHAYDGAEKEKEDYMAGTGGFYARAIVDDTTKEIIVEKISMVILYIYSELNLGITFSIESNIEDDKDRKCLQQYLEETLNPYNHYDTKIYIHKI